MPEDAPVTSDVELAKDDKSWSLSVSSAVGHDDSRRIARMRFIQCVDYAFSAERDMSETAINTKMSHT